MGHGETCALGCRDLAQSLHMWWGPGFFPPFFPILQCGMELPGLSPFLATGSRHATRSCSRWHGPPGAVGWDDLMTEPLAMSCLSSLGRRQSTPWLWPVSGTPLSAGLSPCLGYREGGTATASTVSSQGHVSPLAHCCPQSSGMGALRICFSTASSGSAQPQPSRLGCPTTWSLRHTPHGGGISPGVGPEGRGDLATAGTRGISPGVWLWLGSICNYLPLAEETWGTWGSGWPRPLSVPQFPLCIHASVAP